MRPRQEQMWTDATAGQHACRATRLAPCTRHTRGRPRPRAPLLLALAPGDACLLPHATLVRRQRLAACWAPASSIQSTTAATVPARLVVHTHKRTHPHGAGMLRGVKADEHTHTLHSRGISMRRSRCAHTCAHTRRPETACATAGNARHTHTPASAIACDSCWARFAPPHTPRASPSVARHHAHALVASTLQASAVARSSRMHTHTHARMPDLSLHTTHRQQAGHPWALSTVCTMVSATTTLARCVPRGEW
jgi:hypothetical protein